jgi:hypothetical protein
LKPTAATVKPFFASGCALLVHRTALPRAVTAPAFPLHVLQIAMLAGVSGNKGKPSFSSRPSELVPLAFKEGEVPERHIHPEEAAADTGADRGTLFPLAGTSRTSEASVPPLLRKQSALARNDPSSRSRQSVSFVMEPTSPSAAIRRKPSSIHVIAEAQEEQLELGVSEKMDLEFGQPNGQGRRKCFNLFGSRRNSRRESQGHVLTAAKVRKNSLELRMAKTADPKHTGSAVAVL